MYIIVCCVRVRDPLPRKPMAQGGRIMGGNTQLRPIIATTAVAVAAARPDRLQARGRACGRSRRRRPISPS